MFIILILLLSLKVHCQVRQWDDVDYEIFDLNDSLQKLLGPDTNFYSFLETDSSADTKAIASAYRKTSRKYHPDKNNLKDVEVFSKLLTSIATILKDDGARRKYDDHLRIGFPVWRGSGYYYKKYRPGLFSVLVIVVLFISNVQYWSGWGIYALGKYIQETTPPLVKKGKKIETTPQRRELKKPKLTDVLVFRLPLLLVDLFKKAFKRKSE